MRSAATAGTPASPRQAPAASRFSERSTLAVHHGPAAGTVPLLPAQAKASAAPRRATQSASGRWSGLPTRLQSGIEALSGVDLSDVRVRADSDEPARFEALAYARADEIHLAPGHEWALPHEAWHVVQQRQGRVRPTAHANGRAINTSGALEREADVMGRRAQNDVHGIPPGADPGAASARTERASFAVAQLKGWEWTGKGWQEVDKSEKGPRPPHEKHDVVGQVYDTAAGGFFKSADKYLKHYRPIVSPPFQLPAAAVAAAAPEVARTPRVHGAAAEKLKSFLKSGVKTPEQLGAGATYSGDERRRRDDQVSVNTLAPTRDARGAARTAHYATMNPANGAIPVVMEQHGDVGTDHPDLEGLSRRAHHSALAVIRPDELAARQQGALRLRDETESGEATLRGPIPASNFARVLVPSAFREHFSADEVDRHKITFVGSKSTGAAYNVGRESHEHHVEVPDYESALSGILQSNPNSTFLTHAIRLGRPEPLAASAVVASSSSAVSSPPLRRALSPVRAAVRPAEEARRSPSALHLATIERSIRDARNMEDRLLDHILPPAIDEYHGNRRGLRLPYRGIHPDSGQHTNVDPRKYKK